MKFVKTQNYLKMKMAKVFDAAPFKTDREMAVPAVRTHDEPLQRYDFEGTGPPRTRLRSRQRRSGISSTPWPMILFLRPPSKSFTVQNEAYSVDDDFHVLKHTIRNLYRQFYLAKASQRRQDCSGQKQPIDVTTTRAFYLSLKHPIHQYIMRYILTGSLDHTHRLYKSNLVTSPVCPHCNVCDETAEHIFWYCPRWDSVRHGYSTLLRLFSLVGTQWPKCFLHCGWIEHFCDYGISFLLGLGIIYNVQKPCS